MFTLFRTLKRRRLALATNFDGGRRRPLQYRRRWPEIEVLEDRTLPTVIFQPQFGNESVDDSHGGLRLRNTQVFLLFWGSYWQSSLGYGEANEIQSGLGQVLAGPYLSDPVG